MIYCEQGGTTNLSHWQGQEQYLWNFSNPGLQAWFVDNFFSTGMNGSRSKWVDG